MDKDIQDVEETEETTSGQNASAGDKKKSGVKEEEEETTSSPPAPVDEANKAVQQELEAIHKTLAKAEATIVKYKRENEKLRKGESTSEPENTIELQEKVARLEEEVETLKSSSKKDETLDELSRAQRKVKELALALIAKGTAGSSAGGANQDKLAKEERLPKLSADDMVVVRQAAQRRKISEKQLIKEWHEAGKI